MTFNLEYADTLTELNILRKKAEVSLDCMIGNANAHDQTLVCIANDYLTAMNEMIQTMQKSAITPIHE